MPIPEEGLAKVREMLLLGRKIEAIRMYRDCTAADLAEAKAAVDRLEGELRAGAKPPIRLVAGVPFGCLLGAAPFAVFGAILLAAGIMGARSSWEFVSRAARTDGTVVRLDKYIPGEGHSNTNCRPVVSYRVGGHTYEVHGYVQIQPGGHGGPRGYRVGETASVLYNPERPREAKVDSFYVWGGSLTPIGLGLTFLLLGIGLFLAERRKWRGRRKGGGVEPVAAAEIS